MVKSDPFLWRVFHQELYGAQVEMLRDLASIFRPYGQNIS